MRSTFSGRLWSPIRLFPFFILLLGITWGCSTAPPPWVSQVPTQPGFVTAVGIGQSPDTNQAIESAREDALRQIVASWFGENVAVSYQHRRVETDPNTITKALAEVVQSSSHRLSHGRGWDCFLLDI